MTQSSRPMLDIEKQLLMPFDPRQVHWRVGATSGNDEAKKGIALAYLDARDVMQRLDETVGIWGWQARYPFAGTCEVGLWFEEGSEWIWKANAAGETQVEAEKGQASDAFKRAAVLWGVGRCYYDLPNQWFNLEKRGRSWVLGKAVQEELSKKLGAWQDKWIKANIR